MKNYYALQYQILIFSLIIFNLIYSFLEYPYIVSIYSIKEGFNVEENLLGYFYELYSYIVNNTFLLKTVYLSKVFIALGLLCKPLRKLLFLLLVVHACIFEDMGSSNTPETEFLNILYLFLIAIPEKKFQLFKSYKKTFWMYPLNQQRLLWIIAALAYSVSGYFKLMTPNWQNGFFMEHLLLHQHLARYDLTPLFDYSWMSILCIILTYFALATELFALPMVFNRYSRLIAYILLTGMHMAILLIVDVGQITFGMLIFHIYLFEPHWLKLLKKCKSKT